MTDVNAQNASSETVADDADLSAIVETAGKQQASDQPKEGQTPDPSQTNSKAKPEFLPDEFWDKDKGEIKTEALVKSQRDLREKISKGLKEPTPAKPEDYKFEFPEGFEMSEGDKASLGIVAQAAHKAGMPNSLLNSFIASVYPELQKAVTALNAEPSEEQLKEMQQKANEAELAKLDKNPEEARKIVSNVLGRFKMKVEQGVLSADDYRALTAGADASRVRALDKLFSVSFGAAPIPINSSNTEGYSLEQHRRDVADPRYQADPSFRREVNTKLEKIVGNKPASTAPRKTA